MQDNTNKYVGQKIQATELPEKEIGIDTNNSFMSNLVGEAICENVNLSQLEGFNQVAQNREQTYQAIDNMALDPTLASYLKTFTADVVKPNDKGDIVWCESKNEDIQKFCNYLLKQIGVQENSFKWVYNLLKYGDLFIRMERESDEDDDDIFKETQEKDDKLYEALNSYLEDDDYGRYSRQQIDKLENIDSQLNEDVKLIVHEQSDHYVHYVEMEDNPAQMFELDRRGKTQGYIKTGKTTVAKGSDMNILGVGFQAYNVNKRDIEVYGATDYVHATLNDFGTRTPEEINIFTDNDNNEELEDNEVKNKRTYKVKRGQSQLATVFKVWRELSLLEDSVLLNRITKSSIIRLIQVQVGSMPKEQIGAHLRSIKSIMEQNTALDTNNGMGEYNNPGPVINNMYVPVRDQMGAITSTTIGGDVDPKQLTDLDWFNNKLFGSLAVPKQYFGFTDDGAGFNGGTSLTILSSRYGKDVERVQVAYCQMLTDILNLFLLDKKLISYVNNFTVKMQPPITQEEIDRRENKRNKVGVVMDIINALGDVQDQVIKLKIVKSLLSDVLNDAEVIGYIQDQIDLLEKQANPEETQGEGTNEKPTPKGTEFNSRPNPIGFTNDTSGEEGIEEVGEMEEPTEQGGNEGHLPSPEEMGMNMIDNTPLENGEGEI